MRPNRHCRKTVTAPIPVKGPDRLESLAPVAMFSNASRRGLALSPTCLFRGKVVSTKKWDAAVLDGKTNGTVPAPP
jgi:hypothetical protein